jgi:hypothetical protein
MWSAAWSPLFGSPSHATERSAGDASANALFKTPEAKQKGPKSLFWLASPDTSPSYGASPPPAGAASAEDASSSFADASPAACVPVMAHRVFGAANPHDDDMQDPRAANPPFRLNVRWNTFSGNTGGTTAGGNMSGTLIRRAFQYLIFIS